MKTSYLIMAALVIGLVLAMLFAPALKAGAYVVGEKAYLMLTKYMHRSGLAPTALFYSDLQSIVNPPSFGQPLSNRAKANRLQGRIRIFESTYVAPAAGTAPAIADKIIWGKLPVKSRVLGYLGLLQWSTGTASCTLNVGDLLVPARHLAATAVTTAGSAVPNAANLVKTATGDITTASNVIQNVASIGAFQMGANVTGTGIPTGSTVTGIDYVARTVTISQAATATTATLAITVTGGSYETQDDSANLANAFTSTTDDCTLVSVVAGAQVANNQVITLKMPFVQD